MFISLIIINWLLCSLSLNKSPIKSMINYCTIDIRTLNSLLSVSTMKMIPNIFHNSSMNIYVLDSTHWQEHISFLHIKLVEFKDHNKRNKRDLKTNICRWKTKWKIYFKHLKNGTCICLLENSHINLYFLHKKNKTITLKSVART